MKIANISQTTNHNGKGFIKSAVILTIGVFLISAPAPDAQFVSEMTSNLIVTTQNLAAEAQFPTNSNT